MIPPQSSTFGRLSRRGVLHGTLASAAIGTCLVGRPQSARAQTSSDIDFLNLGLNLNYLLTQYASAILAEAVPADRLTGNGVPGTPVLPGRKVTFTDNALRRVLVEISADDRNELLPIRNVIGALAQRQPLIDISVGPQTAFSVLMQRAGVVAPGETFDPYASENNALLGMLALKNISVAAYRGLAPNISNRVVVQNFTGILGSQSIHASAVRNFLYTRSAATPMLAENARRIAAYQNALVSRDVFQGIAQRTASASIGGAAVTVANISSAQPTGETAGLTAGEVLRELYLANGPATSGGFYPEGVNGTLRTSS